jgi:putative oxidoreductase
VALIPAKNAFELKGHHVKSCSKSRAGCAAFCCAANRIRLPPRNIFHGVVFSLRDSVACAFEDAGFNHQTRGYDVDQTFARFQPIALSLFRFITGLLLFQYGVAKLLKFPAGNPFEKVELFSLIGAAGVCELVLGGLLMIGLFSRIVAFILSGEMAFAYFIGHFPHGFFPLLNNGTAAILFCFACLYLATAGGGPYSVDAMMGKKS